MEDQRDLVAACWRYFALSSSCEREDRLAAGDLPRARDLVDESMRSDAEDALALLIDRATVVSGNSEALSYLSAGPVEDFVVYQPQGRETLYHEVV